MKRHRDTDYFLALSAHVLAAFFAEQATGSWTGGSAVICGIVAVSAYTRMWVSA